MTRETSQPDPAPVAPAWPVAEGDGDSALLAERWEAFARLLQAATPAVDTAALEVALRRRLASRARRAESWRWLTVAAAVLLLVGMAWSLARTGLVDSAPAPRMAQQTTMPPAPPAATPPQHPAPAHPEAAPRGVEWPAAPVAWTEEFDDELNNLRAGAAAVESAWRQPFDAAAGLRWQMERLDGTWSEMSL